MNHYNHHSTAPEAAQSYSARGQLFDIVRPFETLTNKEQKQAASAFNDLVHETLYRFEDKVRVYDGAAARPYDVDAMLFLSGPVAKDGAHVNIRVRSRKDGSGREEREISLQQIVDGRGRDSYRYYMDSNDCVRRANQGDLYAQINHLDYSSGPKRNQREQEKLGVNFQPVSTKEIAALRQLIEAAEVNNAL